MPIRMPEGKKCVVCLTYDFDAISLQIETFGFRTPGRISRGEFGARVGIYRILDLLDKYSIEATFFVPGHTADTYPEQTKLIHQKGHEIGHHGYCHETTTELSCEEEKKILHKGMDSLKRVTGVNPVGYRSPAFDVSPNTIQLLIEHGFIYTSHLMADDFQPHRIRVGDTVSSTEPFKFGKEIDIIDIPVSWYLCDTVPLEFSYPSFENRQGLPPSAVLEIWTEEFDYMYNNVDGGVFTLTSHPFCIGHGYRIRLLDKLIQHIRGYEGVWFARMDEVARAWVARDRVCYG